MGNDIITVNKGDIAAKDWLDRRDALLEAGKAITQVTDDAELEVAGKFETDAKRHIKALSAIRMNLTRPLDEAKKEICAKEKELVRLLEEAQKRVNAMTTAYANEIRRRQEEERRAAEAAERAAAEAALAAEEAQEQAAKANALFGLDVAAMPAQAPIVPVPVARVTAGPHTSSNRFVERWEFAVTDANAVPRELCSPDPAKIRAFMQAKKAEGYRADQIAVAGLRFSASMQVYGR